MEASEQWSDTLSRMNKSLELNISPELILRFYLTDWLQLETVHFAEGTSCGDTENSLCSQLRGCGGLDKPVARSVNANFLPGWEFLFPV